MVADYELAWDTSHSQEMSGRTDVVELGGRYGNDISRHQPYVSRYSPENGRAKRFRVRKDLHTELQLLILTTI